MSASGTKRTSEADGSMSAFGGKADMSDSELLLCNLILRRSGGRLTSDRALTPEFRIGRGHSVGQGLGLGFFCRAIVSAAGRGINAFDAGAFDRRLLGTSDFKSEAS
jgi:hypothetical protein